MARFFKFIFKAIAAIVVLLALAVGALLISLKANPPEELFVPELAQNAVTASSNLSYMVIGGRKGTGLEVIKVLRSRGERVTAMIRPASNTPEKTGHLTELGVDIVEGDATVEEDVANALAAGNYLAIVSTIGCFNCVPPSDFLGNKIITDAAVAAGVNRVVQVSSIGAGNSLNTAPWISRTALAKVLPLKTQAEDYLAKSGLDYTIIRPGGLKNGTESGGGYLSADVEAFGFIDRADLGRLIVGCLDDDRCVDQTLHAADETRTWIFD